MEDETNGRDAQASGTDRIRPGEPLPWTKFYWAQWLSNPALRRLTPEQRGRFMDVFAATHGTSKPGDMTEEDVRLWAGYSVREWADARGAFAGVFNTTRRRGRWLLLDVIETWKASMQRAKRFKKRAKVAATSRRRKPSGGNEMTSRSSPQAPQEVRGKTLEMRTKRTDVPEVQTVAGSNALPRFGTDGTVAVSDLLTSALSAGSAGGTDGTGPDGGGARG